MIADDELARLTAAGDLAALITSLRRAAEALGLTEHQMIWETIGGLDIRASLAEPPSDEWRAEWRDYIEHVASDVAAFNKSCADPGLSPG